MLEILVHLEAEDLPGNLAAFRIELPPDGAAEIRTDVPEGWLDDPLRRQCRRVGDTWAAEARSLALRVPSAVVREEFNILLNPLHPRFGEVRVLDSRPFRFDPRLK